MAERPSDEVLARMLAACLASLDYEGIGHDHGMHGLSPSDEQVEQVRDWVGETVVKDPSVEPHELWEAGLIGDEMHPPCGRCSYRAKWGKG
jgi:hypothetical protein